MNFPGVLACPILDGVGITSNLGLGVLAAGENDVPLSADVGKFEALVWVTAAEFLFLSFDTTSNV